MSCFFPVLLSINKRHGVYIITYFLELPREASVRNGPAAGTAVGLESRRENPFVPETETDSQKPLQQAGPKVEKNIIFVPGGLKRTVNLAFR